LPVLSSAWIYGIAALLLALAALACGRDASRLSVQHKQEHGNRA
jgi:hypothetical protein